MGFLSKSRLKASELVEQAVQFLTQKYNQVGKVFTPASPFGQLLMVISNISELIFTYIAHVAESLNIYTAETYESIHGLSRLTGHDPFRGQSARGTIQIKLNPTANDKIEGSYIKINNGSSLTIADNGLKYFMNLGTDFITLNLNDTTYTTIPIIEGEKETQTYVSDGSPLQSFNPIVKQMSDHTHVKVYVNSEEWEMVDSLYDMTPDGKQFMCKTSINIGLTIFFGNGEFGRIPSQGAEIIVEYIKCNGESGNIENTAPQYSFNDTAVDEMGNEVDLNEVLSVITMKSPSMGTDFENPEFTKLIAPKASKSFVLATPENYESYLSKYNQFSSVHAYNTKEDNHLEDDNVIYLRILPDVSKKFTSGYDYFSLPETEYTLSNSEKENIMVTLEDSGRMLIGSEVQIDSLDIKHFIINVIVKYFEGADKQFIKTEIRNRLSTYFVNINRKDIIPLSDLISLLENIQGIDTVNIFFINEENEDAIVNGYYTTKSKVWDDETLQYVEKTNIIQLPTGIEDPRIGFDDFGNLIIPENTLMLPRGGWYDRGGNYFEEVPKEGALSGLNVFFIDETDKNAYSLSRQQKFNTILKNYL